MCTMFEGFTGSFHWFHFLQRPLLSHYLFYLKKHSDKRVAKYSTLRKISFIYNIV